LGHAGKVVTLEWRGEAWTTDFSAAWRNYRRRRFVSRAVYLSYIPGTMAIFLGVGLPLSSLTGVKADYFLPD
jgi:uncharacterized membrane protein YfcA